MGEASPAQRKAVSLPAHPHSARVRSTVRYFVHLSLTALVACGGARGSSESPAPAEQPDARPLAMLASQRVIVTPVHSVLSSDAAGWAAQAPRTRDALRVLDDEIAIALGDRGLKSQWIYPPDLARAARNSPTYAVDPYTIGANPLRTADIKIGARVGDPLATQLRTMVALQEARLVVIPVELRYEKDKSGQGIAALKLAVIDGRLGEMRWSGTVRSDPAPLYSRAVLTSLAAHVADLITAP